MIDSGISELKRFIEAVENRDLFLLQRVKNIVTTKVKYY